MLRALRPFFLLNTRQAAGTRRAARQIWQALQRVFDVLLLLFFYVAVFAAAGVYLYKSDPNDWFFASFGTAYTQLFVLITTSNFPDIMLPSYARSRWNFLFFLVFVVGGVYFLANLVLAVVYQNYTVCERDKYRRMLQNRRRALRAAWNALTEHGGRVGRRGLLLADWATCCCACLQAGRPHRRRRGS